MRRLGICVAVAAALVLSALPAVAGNDFQTGVVAVRSGDYVRAARIFARLARQGDARAQHNLGAMYARGLGLRRDYGQARQWYERAAAQGHSLAMNNLGTMYLRGQGVTRDLGRAARWYRRSAERGYPRGMYNLAISIYKGWGVARDLVQCYKWLWLAALRGHARAARVLPVVARQMTPAQVKAAKGLARVWRPTPVPLPRVDK
ncbi:MAG: sel1 repeat family protein [Proteobacteria bacterium]|nr:sel1 repeat family protein [Pseudomonadota bacterium]MBU1741601.1 sel1 repeat family protein [Pseudomonadota bacterium]